MKKKIAIKGFIYHAEEIGVEYGDFALDYPKASVCHIELLLAIHFEGYVKYSGFGLLKFT